MSNFSILVLDDHPIYRDALCEKLTMDFLQHGITVSSAANIDDAISIIQRTNKIWIVLLDLILPNSDPEQLIAHFKAHNRIKFLITLSGLDESEWQAKSQTAGADLFISKNNTSHFIYQQICALIKIDQPDADSNKQFALTQRQIEVLKCIATGYSNKAIADQLSISEQTVKIHINSIFKKLSVSNRTQSVHKAQILRLI
jgi:DNA-binding NarL/FixJ family response regulator